MGKCELNKEEQDALEEMRKVDERDMEKFGTLDINSSEKTIAILRDSWRPQKTKQEGDNISKKFVCNTCYTEKT